MDDRKLDEGIRLASEAASEPRAAAVSSREEASAVADLCKRLEEVQREMADIKGRSRIAQDRVSYDCGIFEGHAFPPEINLTFGEVDAVVRDRLSELEEQGRE